jgi:hypothetical protein
MVHCKSHADSRRARFLVLVAASIVLATWSIARTARAERYEYYREREERRGLELGFDADGAFPLSTPRFLSGNTLSGGGGFKLRAGEEFRLPRLRFTPEIGYDFHHLFATDDIGDAFAWDLHRAFAGVRLGFGRLLVPVLYGHVGYGWRDTGDPTVRSASGLTLDAGFALELRLVSFFSFGAHVDYTTIDSQPYTPQWLTLGLQANLIL